MKKLIPVNIDIRETYEALDALLDKIKATDNGKKAEEWEK